jgi:hypothetical protein
MTGGHCMPPGACELRPNAYCASGTTCNLPTGLNTSGNCVGITRTGPLCPGNSLRCRTGYICGPRGYCYDAKISFLCGDLICSKGEKYPAGNACARCQGALAANSAAGSPASKTSIGSPVLISVGTTPAEAERLLETPLHALPQGVYKLDREYDFNVLDAVYYDAGSRQISLVGHRDDHFKGPPIPYLEHLATLLENPSPRFTLNLTPDSYRRANAFFNWAPTRLQAEKFNKELYDVIDARGNVTPIGRYMLPSFGIYPVHDNKTPGYLGIETHLTKDGMTAVTRVAPNSPAAKAGIIAGDWITFFDDGPIVSPIDRPVYHPQDLAHRVRYAGAGTTLNITFQRGVQPFKKSVTLTADSQDPWLGVTRYDLVAALYRAAGDERAARVIEAFGLLKDSPMGNPALGATLARFIAALNLPPDPSPEARGRALAMRLDEIFAFPGNPVLAAFNANFAKTRNASAAIHPALDQMDKALVPKVLQLLERPLDQPGGFQIPPEVVDRLWSVRAEMTPEYRGVPADSLLGRAMFESDYLTKRLTNRPDLKLKFPTYQTEFEYRRTHGLNKDDGVFRTWISVAKLDVAQSSSGDTLELRDVEMRYNISKLDNNGIDLPNQQPSGYADLLTSLYNDFAREYPSLHELREIAKLTAIAAWLHGKTPSLRLPKEGAVKWRGPAKVPGLAYTYLYNRDRKLFYQMLVEGGVNLNLQPFLWPTTGVVDARGTSGGGALPRGAPLIPTSPAGVVDLRKPDGGYLIAPPPYDDAAGWVVHVDAIHGGRQSVSVMLDRIRTAVKQDSRASSESCRALNDQIADLKEAQIPAYLSDQVYNKYDPNLPAAATPAGFKLISDDKSIYVEMKKLLPGVEVAEIRKLIDPENTDYRAAIYKDEKTGKIFVAFRGTQSADDGSADFNQGLGDKVSYYDRATKLAELLKHSPDVQKYGIEFVGHSLGGGLAAAASLVACGPDLSPAPPRRWKCSADTFNASGVHPKTVVGKDLRAAQGYIKSYVVEHEPLNTLQDHRAMTAAGISGTALLLGGGVIPAEWAPWQVATNDALPPSLGRRTTVPIWKGGPPIGLARHSISTAIEALRVRIEKLQSQYANDCAARRPGEVPVPRPEASDAWKN